MEEAKPDRTDLKLDLKKNEPTVSSKEPTKEVLREFELHMDKLMNILKEVCLLTLSSCILSRAMGLSPDDIVVFFHCTLNQLQYLHCVCVA